MRIAFIETAGLTNDLLRAVAGAHPLCVGYPDGVPESWRDESPAVASQWESDGGPVDMGVLTVGVSSLQRVPEGPRRQFTTPPRYDAEYWNAMAVMDADYGIDPAEYGADPAALLGPVAEPADWPDERGDDEC